MNKPSEYVRWSLHSFTSGFFLSSTIKLDPLQSSCLSPLSFIMSVILSISKSSKAARISFTIPSRPVVFLFFYVQLLFFLIFILSINADFSFRHFSFVCLYLLLVYFCNGLYPVLYHGIICCLFFLMPPFLFFPVLFGMILFADITQAPLHMPHVEFFSLLSFVVSGFNTSSNSCHSGVYRIAVWVLPWPFSVSVVSL